MAIITISRGSFGGGKAVAERLGDRLGLPVLSREDALGRAANDFGIQVSDLKETLSKSPPYWQQKPGKRLAYVKCLTAVLLDCAKDGNLIYHGRVGHLLLASVPHVLRVRIIADMEYRIQSAMEKVGLEREAAVAHIRNVDEARSQWARLLYGVDWEDPRNYTAVFNLQEVGVDGVCETIVRMTELDDFKQTAADTKSFEDLRLSCKVWASLASNPKTRSAGLEVQADDGDVLIQGSVGSTAAAELVPQIAGEVEGVKAVRSEAGMGTDWYW
jgi:cytidylate kinase